MYLYVLKGDEYTIIVCKLVILVFYFFFLSLFCFKQMSLFKKLYSNSSAHDFILSFHSLRRWSSCDLWRI